MKIALSIVGVAAALVMLSFSLRAEEGKPDAQRESWEHMMVPRDAAKPLSDPEFAATIQRLGREGWEMVEVATLSKDGSTTKLLYYFKRAR